MKPVTLLRLGALAMAPASATPNLQAEETRTLTPGFDARAHAPLVEKNGRTRQDNSHLTYEEREWMDRLASQRTPSDVSPTDSSGKPLEVAFGSISTPLSEIDLHLQLDEAPDGTLWAFGGTYKASFDTSGATYIPFLGSQAPQNYPLRFEAPVITVDGEALALDSRAMPEFDDHTAVFDRGGVVERYDVRRGEIEQLFVFDDLPSRGELLVRTAVASELLPGERGDMLAFSGPHGGVGYSFAVAFDAAGARIDVPTAHVDGAIELRVPASFVADAVLPLTIDPVVSTIDISPDATRNDTNPDIAYDGTSFRWYVVWEREFSATDDDIYGEMYSSFGDLLNGTGAYIDLTSAQWRAPHVANNRQASNFLVVCQVEESPVSIWGRTRAAHSVSHSGPFRISNTPNDCRNPGVGGDPTTVGVTYYCVVWEEYVDLAVDHDIRGQLVNPSGALAGFPIEIDTTGGTYDKVPSISKSNGRTPISTQSWNITWQRQWTSTDWDIRYAQVSRFGTILTPSSSLDFSGSDDRWPDSSSNLDSIGGTEPREWLAVYERRDADGIDDIQAASMRGPIRMQRVNLSTLIGAGEGQDQVQPCVDASNDQFVVAWSERYLNSTTDFDIYAASVYLAGFDVHVSEGRTNLAFSGDFELHVEVCARASSGLAGDAFGLVWRDFSLTSSLDSDVEGTVYETPDHFGADIGQPYCVPISNSTGVPALVTASGSAHAGGEPLTLTAFQMPAQVNGYFIGSPNQGNALPAHSSGRVCVGLPLARFNAPGQVMNSGSTGRFSVEIDTQSIPTPTPGVTTPISAGETFHFQCWYRDGATNNLTNGISVQFH